jgi:hypothetical protein
MAPFPGLHFNRELWERIMNTSRRGVSVVAGIVILVVVAGVALGGLYFFSDVFRTKMDRTWEGFSKWTPENIAKDPQGYLTFAEEQAKKAQTKLKASEIAIAQSKGDCQAKREDAQKAMDAGQKGLKDLKAVFVDANGKNAWPVKWMDHEFNQEQTKKQIVRLARECQSKSKQIEAYKNAEKELETQASKVQDAKDKADEQLTSIQSSREQLKVKAITDDLKNQLVAMKGVLETSVVDVADKQGTMSLDALVAKTESTVKDEDFSKIMNQK